MTDIATFKRSLPEHPRLQWWDDGEKVTITDLDHPNNSIGFAHEMEAIETARELFIELTRGRKQE